MNHDPLALSNYLHIKPKDLLQFLVNDYVGKLEHEYQYLMATRPDICDSERHDEMMKELTTILLADPTIVEPIKDYLTAPSTGA